MHTQALDAASRGFNFVLVSRTHSKTQAVADELLAKATEFKRKIDVRVVTVDAAKEEPETYAQVLSAVKDLDVSVLVNNVGVISVPGLFHTADIESVTNMIDVNNAFSVKLTHAFLPILLKRNERFQGK